jgi:type IV pilus assembly protein PilM
MTDKPNALHTLGLELNGQQIRGAQLSLRKGKPFLERAFEIELKTEKSEERQALLACLKKDLVVTCLNVNEILIRQLEVKLKKEVDIDAVLAFQSEPLLPYPIENAILDRVKLSETAEGSQLAIYAARKDHIQQHLEQWHAFEAEPEVISCSPAALAAFAAQFALSDKPLFVLHIGLAGTFCILTKQGKLHAAQACSQGTTHLIEAFKLDNSADQAPPLADLRSLNFVEINKENTPHLAEAVDVMRLDVIRTLYALSKQAKGEEVSQILLTGEGATFNNLGAVLCQSLQKALIVPATDPQFNLTPAELQKFAIPIGAALTALPHYKEQINFRQQDLAYPNPWRRYKNIIGIYAAACLCLAIAFYFMSNAYVKYREDQLRQQYAELLEFMHKPYNEFEKEYDAKATGKKVSDLKEAPPIKSLTEIDLVNRLHYIEDALQSSPYYYPLLPNVPTVSDVLAWLSTNSNVVAKDPKTGILKPLLQIESFNYSLAKRPDQTKKQEKYQVKIEIEFSSPTPKLAREFHDALIAPNALVDPKGEVKWNTNRGLYRASFFLKDKTAYPSS